MNELDKIIQKYLNTVGDNLVQNAKQNCPVKTGALRDSIEKKIEGNSVIVGSDIHYAKYIELGTIHIAPRAFLRRALYNRTNYKG